MRPAVPAMQVAAGTQAVGTAKDGISTNKRFLPSGSNSTSQRFEPFFLTKPSSLHNIRYRKSVR
jgi:hypothetical protein